MTRPPRWQEWVHKHYRNVTPLVTSAAESLAGTFYTSFTPLMQRGHVLSLPQFARLLMRDPELSGPFAGALHMHMGAVDMLRPNRNPTYRQLSMIGNTKIREHYRLMEDLSGRRERFRLVFRRLATPETSLFDPLVVDWHGIVGQLPMAHKYFQRGTENLAMRFRATTALEPPWLQGDAIAVGRSYDSP